jgi:glucose/arabinose dehydrogenase
MYFTDNGADGMGDDRPPDELNVLRPGAFYGVPTSVGGCDCAASRQPLRPRGTRRRSPTSEGGRVFGGSGN